MSMSHPTVRPPPVLLLSSGRSGSTLLQKLLNTHPELAIFGEHNGILEPILSSLQMVEDCEWIPETEPRGRWLLDPVRANEPERWTAWDGSFSRDSYRHGLRRFIDDLFSDGLPRGVRWGFKEIRYLEPVFLDRFSHLYPQARYLLLARDPVATCVSFAIAGRERVLDSAEAYRGDLEQIAASHVRPAFQLFREIERRRRADTLLLCYDDLLQHAAERLQQVADFLSLNAGFVPAKLAAVLERDIVSQRERATPDLLAALSATASVLLPEELQWYRSQLSRRCA